MINVASMLMSCFMAIPDHSDPSRSQNARFVVYSGIWSGKKGIPSKTAHRRHIEQCILNCSIAEVLPPMHMMQ